MSYTSTYMVTARAVTIRELFEVWTAIYECLQRMSQVDQRTPSKSVSLLSLVID